MRVDDDILNTIVTRILAVTRPDRIFLFGSAVHGEIGEDSDIDLLVLEPAPGNVRRESVQIRDALRGLGVPIDVMVMRTDRYEQSEDVFGGIAYPVHKYGRLLYGAA